MPNPSKIERDNQPNNQPPTTKTVTTGSLVEMLIWLQESLAKNQVNVDSPRLSVKDLLTQGLCDTMGQAWGAWVTLQEINTLTAERDAAREEVITLHEEILKHEQAWQKAQHLYEVTFPEHVWGAGEPWQRMLMLLLDRCSRLEAAEVDKNQAQDTFVALLRKRNYEANRRVEEVVREAETREQKLHDEIARLRGDLASLEAEKVRIELDLSNVRGNYKHLAERVAAQSELLSRKAEKLPATVEVVIRRLAGLAAFFQVQPDNYVSDVNLGSLTVGDLRACAALVRNWDAVKDSQGERVAITEDDGESD